MSNPAFGLTDSELAALTHDELLAQYRNLRGHHQAAVRAHDKRDRQALLHMAGTIAAGIVASPGEYDVGGVAKAAVAQARAILAEVDRGR